MVACYLALIEIGKRWFYRTAPAGPATRHRHSGYRLLRRAARFTTAGSLPGRSRAASARPVASGNRPRASSGADLKSDGASFSRDSS